MFLLAPPYYQLSSQNKESVMHPFASIVYCMYPQTLTLRPSHSENTSLVLQGYNIILCNIQQLFKRFRRGQTLFHTILIVEASLSMAYIPADSIVSFATQTGAGRKNGDLNRLTGRYLDPGSSSFSWLVRVVIRKYLGIEKGTVYNISAGVGKITCCHCL